LIAVAELPKIANQIHIPVQSGSDKILSSMHRGYNQKKYLSKIDMIKDIIPNVSLSSDVIVGFPGEDDQDFKETMKVVNYAEFDLIYMFKFSPRTWHRSCRLQKQFCKETIN
jgi:tRNA-2-methylthio-N6-dimethylallyladenosine synthase